MQIGLVGEAPTDTKAIENLLKRRYPRASFVPLIENVRGSDLDNPKTVHLLRASYYTKRPDYVIFIRDLDSLETDRSKRLERLRYFRKNKGIVNHKAIFLLHIYEIEALVLTDAEVLNRIYKSAIDQYPDVMVIPEPKEILKANSTYKEGHCADLLSQISFDKALQCRYFNAFITELDKHLN